MTVTDSQGLFFSWLYLLSNLQGNCCMLSVTAEKHDSDNAEVVAKSSEADDEKYSANHSYPPSKEIAPCSV